jgi:hypothetical protein
LPAHVHPPPIPARIHSASGPIAMPPSDRPMTTTDCGPAGP